MKYLSASRSIDRSAKTFFACFSPAVGTHGLLEPSGRHPSSARMRPRTKRAGTLPVLLPSQKFFEQRLALLLSQRQGHTLYRMRLANGLLIASAPIVTLVVVLACVCGIAVALARHTRRTDLRGVSLRSVGLLGVGLRHCVCRRSCKAEQRSDLCQR